MELGSVYYQYGKYAESEAQYKRALENLNKSEEKTLTAYNLSKVLYDDGKYAEASRYGWMAYDEKDFLINDAQQANITYNYALIQERNNKTEDAKRYYKEALTLHPDHVKSKINLSALYMSEGSADVDKALGLLQEAYKTDSNDFSVNNNLGTAYMLKEDYPKAVSYYKAALEIRSDDEDALLNLANAQTKNGELADASRNFSKITSKNPENLEAYVGLAKVLLQLGDTQGAYKNLLYVRGKNPSFRKAEVDSLIAVLEN
jgi:tetratricopeptide (TPR) repeat protein